MKIPKFRTEKEEANFWDTHSGADFLDKFKEVKAEFPKPRKRPVPILLDEGRIGLLKNFASQKGIGYGTLVKMWIVERLNYEVHHLKFKRA